MKSVNFEDYIFYFFKEESSHNILTVILSDSIDESELINYKIRKIDSIFKERYSESINHFDGNVNIFSSFKDLLIEMNLTKRNCGEHPECSNCPNRVKSLKFLTDFDLNKKSFLSRFKSFFFKKEKSKRKSHSYS